ncbi:uncharacterized protein LOC123305782 isoform X2 [Chrysoperla carnea]|uniref:uncharacterized protein LOC123305782 isoform X2 n=1 Tax=Chrysoperla carnea TaxID=189513 RepID=UPI001D075934|nr:uncharacterized protein LOC123305782 isoform X2 [Chrysoperla carnea]
MSDKRVAGLNPASIPPSLRKKSPLRFSRSSVLKMVALMEQTQSQNNFDTENSETDTVNKDGTTSNGQVNDFLSTGRTGRRNALPDILSEHAHVTSSDLPARLQALSTKDSTVCHSDYSHYLLTY